MADLNLEDLLQQKSGSAGQEAAADTGTQEKTVGLSPARDAAGPLVPVTAAEVEQAVVQLTPEEKKQVATIKESIDLRDPNTATVYGAAAQKDIATFSDSVLSEVRTRDAGEVGQLLSELTTDVKKYDAGKSGFLSKMPIVGSLVDKAKNWREGYAKLSVQVDKIKSGLEQSRMKLMKDIVMFDNLYEKNFSYYKKLQLYIAAGEEKLEELRQQTLPRLRAQAAQSSDPMALQAVSDFEASVNRFEKKVHDLKISRTMAIQTAPQIRLIQNNDKMLIDKVQMAIYSTIPLWKSQLVIALGLQAQQQVIALQRQVSDTTNELLKRNAEALKQNTIQTAQESERSIVDVDTIKKVNEDLISTIDETIRIQQEGHEKRMAAEKELVEIDQRLKEALLERSGRKVQG